MGFPLTPITSANEKPFPFSVLDIEAYKWIQFRVMGFYDGKVYKEFRKISEYFDYMADSYAPKGRAVEVTKKGDIKVRVFAHFGGKYDFNFLLKELALELDESWTLGSMIPRGSGILCFDATRGNLTLSFYDSSALLPFSLAKLTHDFNVPTKKGSFDFEKWDGKITQELLDYLKDDCRALFQVLEQFYNWPVIKKAGPAVTMASQAMKVFRTFLDQELMPPSNSVDSFVRRGYFGGRTEIFKPYFEQPKGKKPLMSFDVNSLYPAVMLENEYPGNFECFSYEYDGTKMGFFEAEVDVPKDMYVPPLGVVIPVPTVTETWKAGQKFEKQNTSNKFVFPTGRFSGVWSTIELEYAKSVGVKIVKTGRGVYFKNAGYLFKEYIDTFYNMRLDAIARGDGVTNVLCKLLMNSLYGRFGLNLDRELLELDIGQEGVVPDMEFKKGKKYVRLVRRPNRLNSFTNVAIPAWVTSHARIKMHKFYMECGRDLWYTDTDSLYTTKKFTDSKDLGFLKWEGNIKRAAFLLPKTYAVEVIEEKQKLLKKLVMKGFDRKKIGNFTIDDFVTALEGDLRILTAEQSEKFCTFRTAMRKGEFLALMEPSSRTLKTRYDKRRIIRVGGEYDTIPLHIQDGEVVN